MSRYIARLTNRNSGEPGSGEGGLEHRTRDLDRQGRRGKGVLTCLLPHAALQDSLLYLSPMFWIGIGSSRRIKSAFSLDVLRESSVPVKDGEGEHVGSQRDPV